MNLNKKNKIICAHRTYKMFYKCPSNKNDGHLHCIKCGLVLKNNLKLRKLLNDTKIYDSKVSCHNLIDHL